MAHGEMLKNFTIILPGGCNANCAFCDDKGDKKAPKDYIQKVKLAIASLPSDFNQVSITGGEPTISPYLFDVLEAVTDSLHFDKVVLTTNGVRLGMYMDKIFTHIDHLNISRHSHTDYENTLIFGTKRVLQNREIPEICEWAHERGVDVNVNRVYTKDTKISAYILKSFVNHLSELGVDKFAFRYDCREDSLDSTFLEKGLHELGYHPVEQNGCPVCRGDLYFIDGIPVTMKAAFNEPTHELVNRGINEVYEYVLHEDGNLYQDWSRKMPVKSKKVISKPPKNRMYTQAEVNRLIKKARKEALNEAALAQKVPTAPKAAKKQQLVHYVSHGCGSNGYGACGAGVPTHSCGRSSGC